MYSTVHLGSLISLIKHRLIYIVAFLQQKIIWVLVNSQVYNAPPQLPDDHIVQAKNILS